MSTHGSHVQTASSTNLAKPWNPWHCLKRHREEHHGSLQNSGLERKETSSKCTACTTPHLNSNIYNFFAGWSQQCRGPAWSTPVTAKGSAGLTSTARTGAASWLDAAATCFWHCKHRFFTCMAKALATTIQNWLLKEVRSTSTPPCLRDWCWNRTKKLPSEVWESRWDAWSHRTSQRTEADRQLS